MLYVFNHFIAATQPRESSDAYPFCPFAQKANYKDILTSL